MTKLSVIYFAAVSLLSAAILSINRPHKKGLVAAVTIDICATTTGTKCRRQPCVLGSLHLLDSHFLLSLRIHLIVIFAVVTVVTSVVWKK